MGIILWPRQKVKARGRIWESSVITRKVEDSVGTQRMVSRGLGTVLRHTRGRRRGHRGMEQGWPQKREASPGSASHCSTEEGAPRGARKEEGSCGAGGPHRRRTRKRLQHGGHRRPRYAVRWVAKDAWWDRNREMSTESPLWTVLWSGAQAEGSVGSGEGLVFFEGGCIRD